MSAAARDDATSDVSASTGSTAPASDRPESPCLRAIGSPRLILALPAVWSSNDAASRLARFLLAAVNVDVLVTRTVLVFFTVVNFVVFFVTGTLRTAPQLSEDRAKTGKRGEVRVRSKGFRDETNSPLTMLTSNPQAMDTLYSCKR